MLGACASGKTTYVYTPWSMYKKEETKNNGKTRVNCRLFITDDVSFAFLGLLPEVARGLDHSQPITADVGCGKLRIIGVDKLAAI